MTEHVDLLSEPLTPLTLADLVANRQVPDSARPNVSLGEIRELAARSATPSSKEAENVYDDPARWGERFDTAEEALFAAYCTGFRQAASFSGDLSSTEMLARGREYVRTHATPDNAEFHHSRFASRAVDALDALALSESTGSEGGAS